MTYDMCNTSMFVTDNMLEDVDGQAETATFP